jgi:DNA-binding HxlR family transcriptional regulator
MLIAAINQGMYSLVRHFIPPHVECAFTHKGLTLGPILDAMEVWGETNGRRRRRL